MGDGLPLQQLRRAGLPLSLLVAAVIFAWVVHAHYPIPRWLFFRYAGAWLRVLFLSLGCLAAGSALLARGFGASLTLVERLTLGLPVGVFVFGLGVFGLGVTGLVEATLLLPLLFLALGWRRLQDDGRRIWRHVFHRRVPRVSAAGLFVFLAGALGVTVLYAQVLSPQATSFDVRWYHAPLAQRYALSGGVVRLEEGFWLGAYPQLLTYIYTWVFVMPGALFDRLATCIALEVLLSWRRWRRSPCCYGDSFPELMYPRRGREETAAKPARGIDVHDETWLLGNCENSRRPDPTCTSNRFYHDGSSSGRSSDMQRARRRWSEYCKLWCSGARRR
jgi:hypothetical protein